MSADCQYLQHRSDNLKEKLRGAWVDSAHLKISIMNSV